MSWSIVSRRPRATVLRIVESGGFGGPSARSRAWGQATITATESMRVPSQSKMTSLKGGLKEDSFGDIRLGEEFSSGSSAHLLRRTPLLQSTSRAFPLENPHLGPVEGAMPALVIVLPQKREKAGLDREVPGEQPDPRRP